MTTNKIVKKWGNSLGVYFTLDDIKIYRLKEGDVVQVDFRKNPDLKQLKRVAIKKAKGKDERKNTP